jgi:hypothetical protein
MMIRMKRSPHSKELIMECALEAFAQAHTNSIDDFRKYESEWNKKLSQLKKKNPLITKDMTYAQFKTFFTNKLKYLYTDKRGTKHQANHTEVVNRIAALEHGFADMSMMQDDKDDRLEDLETAYHSRSHVPPSYCVPRDDGTMATEGSTIGSAATYKAMMADHQRASEQRAAEQQRAFEARIERMISNSSNTTGKNTSGGKQWSGSKGTKQYKFYCSLHGVNISHHSGNCKDKRPGHNTEATFKNKMGGSNKRSDLYMQWRNLDTGELCKTCPTD